MNKCCEQCYGRQGTLAGGGVFCANEDCLCHSVKPEEWEETAKEIISKVCCDGQYMNESIDLIRSLLLRARSDMARQIKEKLEAISFEQENYSSVDLYLNWDDGVKIIEKFISN